jgi:adenylate kinase family enzyme
LARQLNYENKGERLLIIQIIGLPGSGKTTLAKALKEHTDVIHLNADEVRADLNKDLGFTPEDRIEQARRMGALARLLHAQGRVVIVDFVCPTHETRRAFGTPDYLIWMNRIEESRFADTNKMWEDPIKFNAVIDNDCTVEEEVQIALSATGLHDWKKPTTLMLGRYQPWHEGHHALYNEAGKRTDNVALGVRNTHGTSEKDPLSFDQVKFYIDKDPAMKDAMVIRFPNITNIVYGRDVGYKIEQVDLGADIHAISATQKRKEMGI